MRVIISVLFGGHQNATGWVVEQDVEALPSAGMPVKIRLGDDGDPHVEGQVYRVWPEDEYDAGGLFVYGGLALPPTIFSVAMEQAGWEPLSREAIRLLINTAENTPALASLHEVTLAVGDPQHPETMVAFRRLLRPADPAIPLFSQRLRLEAVRDVTLADIEPDSDDESDNLYQEEMNAIEAEIADPTLIDGLSTGLPVITLYSATVKTGVGRVLFWTPSLGQASELDMVANDWETIAVPVRFNPDDFRLERRLDLAKRTTVTFQETDYGTVVVRDWSIDDPALVTEDDHALLPPLLIEHCRAQMEFDNIDAMLDQWRQMDDGSKD